MRRLYASACVACCALAGVMGFDATAAGAADSGQQVFTQCAACHSTDGSASLGPTLKGIVGRPSASVSGFSYSPAMKRSHLTWTAAELDKYIANPQGTVPGNTMPYPGLNDASQRAALIAYLATLK